MTEKTEKPKKPMTLVQFKRALARDQLDFTGVFFVDGLQFKGLEINDCDFTGAMMRKVNFVDCDLNGSTFYKAELRNARFEECDLTSVSFNEADLALVLFARISNFEYAEFFDANLKNSFFRMCDMDKVEGLCTARVPHMSSRATELLAVFHKSGLMLKTGCFYGTADEFKEAVVDAHGEKALYLDVLKVFEKSWKIWKNNGFPTNESQ